MNEKVIQIRNPWMINPFFYYSFVWLIALLVYCSSPSSLNTELDTTLVVFIAITMMFSAFLTVLLNNTLKGKYTIKNEKLSYKGILLLILFYTCDFIYGGGVPLFGVLFGMDVPAYNRFIGIPTLHMIILTFSLYFIIKSWIQYIAFKRAVYASAIFVVFLYFFMLYLRGMIFVIIFSFIGLFFCIKPLNVKDLFYTSIAIIVLFWGFGVLGNIRCGNEWYDSYAIMALNEIDGDRYDLLSPFYWTSEYLGCSLRNLNYNINISEPTCAFTDLFYYVFPDFISKIFEDGQIARVMLQVPALTTSTMYGGVYCAFGFLGMFILFTIYFIFNMLFFKIRFFNNLNKLVALSICSSILFFSAFSDMLRISAFSFPVFWCLYLDYINHINIRRRT